jgi:hypothetical protein
MPTVTGVKEGVFNHEPHPPTLNVIDCGLREGLLMVEVTNALQPLGGSLIELTRNLAVKLADRPAAAERLTLVKAAGFLA